MENKLDALIDKNGFLERLSKTLKVKEKTLNEYFAKESSSVVYKDFPSKNKTLILKALDLQLKLDEETRQREVVAWELLK